MGPSVIRAGAKTFVANEGFVDASKPRALELDGISGIVEDFRTASARAIEAGFDGVELHGAHGYLLDAFLRDGTNHRTDAYGGSIENRARLLFEVAKVCADTIGADRLRVRISPVSTAGDSRDRPSSITSSRASIRLAWPTCMWWKARLADPDTPVRSIIPHSTAVSTASGWSTMAAIGRWRSTRGERPGRSGVVWTALHRQPGFGRALARKSAAQPADGSGNGLWRRAPTGIPTIPPWNKAVPRQRLATWRRSEGAPTHCKRASGFCAPSTGFVTLPCDEGEASAPQEFFGPLRDCDKANGSRRPLADPMSFKP